ncbi:DUF1445 domain-containing protein [Marivibrio halodurans]|uniref:DUF1445 domain-containing protein n=1 Tax=Marivibrio halodurans TaxID=2039722 RepID=A0A8J7V1Y3_9PROT|nr:DUF1445 domain-containing protein [Marivibrio halodurans]MBP5858271.1 DUF1445 domain-containing protein [Marivibrio halodurans]
MSERGEERRRADPVLAARSPSAARRLIREGMIDGPTQALAAGHLQAALVVVPEADALAFARLCALNPRAFPLLAMSAPGDRALPTLAGGLDLARDLPGYRVIRDGVAEEGERADVSDLWRADLVAFALGTGQGMEAALMAADLEVREVSEAHSPPLYESNIPLIASGAFAGRLWVTMRPFSAGDAIRAIEIAARYPLAHGAPVHFGDPGAIGIDRLSRPDGGVPSRMREGEVPLFWPSTHSAATAIRAARPGLALLNAPGKRLITDLPIDRAWDR